MPSPKRGDTRTWLEKKAKNVYKVIVSIEVFHRSFIDYGTFQLSQVRLACQNHQGRFGQEGEVHAMRTRVRNSIEFFHGNPRGRKTSGGCASASNTPGFPGWPGRIAALDEVAGPGSRRRGPARACRFHGSHLRRPGACQTNCFR